MNEYLPSINYDSEISDIHVDAANANIVVTTPDKLRVLDLVKGKLRWAMDDLQIGKTHLELRSAKFGSIQSDGFLFVVSNSKNRKDSYIRKYSVHDWSLNKTKRIGNKPITALCIRYEQLT